mgnify:CR=1 FL=1
MDIIYKISLLLHIGFGALALLSGIAAMILKKGGYNHKMAGKTFYYSMWLVVTIAIFIAVFKQLIFLFHIGVFAFYQNYFGYRALKDKMFKANFLDWFVLLGTLVNGIFMVYTGQIILLIFGGISLLLIYNQFKIYRSVMKGIPLPKLLWLKQHIGLMMGSFIATVTAFVVVNVSTNSYYLQVALWLLPTVLLVPLSIYWQNKFVKQK